MKLKELVKNPSTKIVDVRTKPEFDMGHVKNAINIPLDSIGANIERLKQLDSSALVFYCRSGNRSGQAVAFLRQAGLSNVFNGGSLEDVNYLLN